MGYTMTFDEEHDALYFSDTDQMNIDRDIYFFIKRFINRETGKAGDKTYLSWNFIVKHLISYSRSGYTGNALSKVKNPEDYVKKCVKRMEKKGWLTKVSSKSRLVIFFNLFHGCYQHYFIEKKDSPFVPPLTAPLGDDDKPHNSKGCSDFSADSAPQDSPLNSPEDSPIPNSSINTNYPTTTPKPSYEQFLMYEGWQPDSSFSDYAMMSGFDINGSEKNLYKAALADLVMFWITPENQQKHQLQAAKSQQMWHNRLLADMKYRVANPHKFKTPSSAQKTTQRRVNNNKQKKDDVVLCNTVEQRIDAKNQQACQRQLNTLSDQQRNDVLNIFNDLVNQQKVKTTNPILLMNLCHKSKSGTLIVPDNYQANNHQSTSHHENQADAIKRGEVSFTTPASFQSVNDNDVITNKGIKTAAENAADFNMLKQQVQFGYAASIAEAARKLHVKAFYDYVE